MSEREPPQPQSAFRIGDENQIERANLAVGNTIGRDLNQNITTHHRPRLIVYPAITLLVVLTLGLLVTGLAFMGINVLGVRQQLVARGMIDEFAPAQPGETLIVIATFFRTEGVDDTDAHNEIRRAIQEQAGTLGLTNLRVEVAVTSLRAEDQAGAEALGKQYDASIVIWGADTKVRVTVNFFNLRQPDFDAAQVNIDETVRAQLANPSAYASFVTEDLPAQLTFLALFTVAQSHYSDKNYNEALRVLESAIAALTPATAESEGVAEAYFRKGWLHQELGHDPQRAIAAYDHVIALNPTQDESYNNRGVAYMNQGNLQAALADFDQAIILNPTNIEAHINRGIVHYKQGSLQAALVDYDQAISLNRNDARAYNNRGATYYKLGNVQAALADFDQAIVLNPTYAEAYYNRGTILYNQGDSEAALADFDQAIDLNPTDAEAYNNRGRIHYRRGNLDEALADWNQAIAFNPTNAESYYNRGLVHKKQGNLVAALDDLDQMIALKPKDADGYYKRGLVHKELGKPDESIADFKKVLEISDDPDLRKEAQNALRALGVEN